MKKVFIVSALLLFYTVSKAQQTDTTTNNSYTGKNLFAMNLIFPGVEFEYGVSSHRSLSVGVSLFNNALSYRTYYNKLQREQKGKNTQEFNANFFAMSMRASPFMLNKNTTLAISPTWGLQRNWRVMHLSFELGLLYGPNGYYFDEHHEIAPFTNFNLGFLFR